MRVLLEGVERDSRELPGSGGFRGWERMVTFDVLRSAGAVGLAFEVGHPDLVGADGWLGTFTCHRLPRRSRGSPGSAIVPIVADLRRIGLL